VWFLIDSYSIYYFRLLFFFIQYFSILGVLGFSTGTLPEINVYVNLRMYSFVPVLLSVIFLFGAASSCATLPLEWFATNN